VSADDLVQPRDRLSGSVLEAAVAVHRATGPGLLEAVYDSCLRYELGKRGVPFAAAVRLPVVYDGRTVGAHYRIDFLVDRQLVLELKSVEALLPVHMAQLITYLKLGRFHRGLLINFNVRRLMDGVRRVVL
jgi:GxxExxY protein